VPVGSRGAQFKAVVAFCRQNLDSSFLEKDELGVLSGQILTQPIGSAGFGYDPIFSPDQFDQSLAQLPPRVKDRLAIAALRCGRLHHFYEITSDLFN
jgi:XTP/dITP diphosphohydrolase